MSSKKGIVLPNNNHKQSSGDNLPPPLKTALDEFYFSMPAANFKELYSAMDSITEDALTTIDEHQASGAWNTFKLMRMLKDLLSALEPYTKNK